MSGVKFELSKEEAKRFRENVKADAKSKYGVGFSLLGEDLQEAIIAREACHVLMRQHLECFTPAQILLLSLLNDQEGD